MKNVVGHVMKWLSILCLVGILMGGVMPFATITGNYKETLDGITGMLAQMPEEALVMMEQALAQYGCEIDFRATVESVGKLTEPLMDGEVAISDFYALYVNANAVTETLSGFAIPEELYALELPEELQSVKDMFLMIEQIRAMAQGLGMVALVPVAVFGLLAFAVVVRILLRLFNRRGLGVLISLLTILNAAFMMAIPYGINYIAEQGLPMNAEYTMVPIMMVVCSILSCILWGIGRKQVGKVEKKEEAPVVVNETEGSEESVVVEETSVVETEESDSVEKVESENE